ncbi:MAG: hypothetical protein AAFY20_24585 [Cyanobacteria bacterium J06639_14]
MNVPGKSDSTLYPSPERVGASVPAGYAPSVPISVYRELAAELKVTQSTVEALTRQNHQLVRQNKLLRNEIQRFVQAAEQLGHFAGVVPQESPIVVRQNLTMAPPVQEPPVAQPLPEPPMEPESLPLEEAIPVAPEVTAFPPNGAIVPHPERDRPKSSHPEPSKQRLFTEQPEETRPLSKLSSRRDLSNLWLATTIMLVIFTAFGAGFLIMRPLLRR